MIDKLIELDKELLIYLNGFHADWLDPAVLLVTETFFWLPLYIFLLYLIFKTYGKESWIALVAIAITIALTDRITSGLMKPYFERLRPSREPTLEGLIHLVRNWKGELYFGGKYGFASSHAANTFATATFFWLLFRSTKKCIVWLFPWAIIMTYTRIYLGVHYPGDIIVGGVIGIACGWIGFKIFKKTKEWNEKRILSRSSTNHS
jgi:undecaprenyl-diphosphatase